MIQLICIKDVQMRISNQIAFNTGQVYAFTLEADGSLSRYSVESGYHSFSAKNWGEWFKYELVLS